MKVLDGIIQGSSEWLAIRAKHNTASEAPAVMGASKYMSRSELLKQKATGIVPEVDSHKQALFNKGHAAEAGARAIAEGMIGEDLFPITAVCEKTNLLASLDGINMGETIVFECKLWNEGLAAQVLARDLEPHYYWQLEQELLVTVAEKVLFVTSDGTRDKFAYMEYFPVAGRTEQLIAAWKQFDIDLAAYAPSETVVPVAAKTVASLPVVFDMRVEGKLVSCNIDQYKPAALAYIEAINTELVTDQNFADADSDAKFCRDSAKKLELAIEQGLGQMGDINRAIAMVREIAAAFNAKGLALEKNVKSEKDNRKLAIVKAGKKALQDHEESLQERTRHHLPPTARDFEGVIKNLRTITSVQNAVDTELARCKIEANATADKIERNLQALAKSGHPELFADVGNMVLKASDDLASTITVRITQHEAKEAARVEADRARIRAEEHARAEKAARDKLAQEQAEAARLAREAEAVAAKEADRVAREAVEALRKNAPLPVIECQIQAVPSHVPAPTLPPVTSVRKALNDRLAYLNEAELTRVLSFVESLKQAAGSVPMTEEQEQVLNLWRMLDDIDTLDDACRSNDAAFRALVRNVQRKRFDVLTGPEFEALSKLITRL